MTLPPVAAHPNRRTCLQATLAACFAPSALAQAGSARVAVVIGNAAYTTSPLANPTRDAQAMATLLRQMGFDVVEARDAGKAQMQAAVASACERLQGRAGSALLYYAGHGVQLDWRNYLLPVDVRLATAADVPQQALDVQSVLQAFVAAGSRTNVLVLDACRDNPFPRSAAARGLAPMDAPPGTFFAYATAPGNVAEDGSPQDGNGLYTRFLLQELRRRDAPIEDVFKRVRLQVRQASQGRQIPWESTSLEEDYVFATGAKAPEPARDAAFDAEKADWDRIEQSQRPEDFYAFLQRHPSGRISEQAQFRLDQLAKPAVLAAAPAGVNMLPAGADRYRVGDSWAFERTDLLQGGRHRIQAEVTAIEGGRVIVNGGDVVLDQMGGILLNRFGAKAPALLGAPGQLQLGKRWRSAFANRREGKPASRNYFEHRVVALEDIEVPAGRFKAFCIDARGEALFPAFTVSLQTRTWVDPATMTPVRHDVRQAARGHTTEDSSDVLLWRRQVPRG